MKDYFNQIEDYLEGNLDKNDRTMFEQQLHINAQLAEAVEEHKIAYEAVDVLSQERLKTQLKNLQKERKQRSKFSIKKYLIPIAASLLLVSLLGLYLVMGNAYSDKGLAMSNFQTYDASGIRGTQENNAFSNGVKAYSTKDYTTALQEFTTLPATHPKITEASLLAGNAAFQLNNNKEAIDQFSKVIASDDARYKEAAQWYQGLSFLKNGQSDLAKKVLQTIVADKAHAYRKKAEALLKDMDSFWR